MAQAHLTANALDGLFYILRRQTGENLNTFVTRFRNTRARVRAYGVDLPESVEGYLFLRKLNLSSDQRQTVLSLAAGRYELEPLIRSAQTLLGENQSTMGRETSRQSDSYRKGGSSRFTSRRGSYGRSRRTYLVEDEAQDEDIEEANSVESESASEASGSDSHTSGSGESEMSEFRAFVAFREARQMQRDNRKGRGFSKGRDVSRSRRHDRGAPSSSRSSHRHDHAPSKRRDARASASASAGPGASKEKVQALKAKTSCRDCGGVGHWSGDVQCPLRKDKRSYVMFGAPPSAFALSQTGATLLIDSGCNNTVFPVQWLDIHVVGWREHLDTRILNTYRFGPGIPVRSLGYLALQLGFPQSLLLGALVQVLDVRNTLCRFTPLR